ncbi:RNA polymerase sigma factor, sigma-70 family [Saccharopolyspora antimicrobica]|uniref:RNA polymerase sigma factor (Sigma-70 family) n=1 Tax=Saccharopolyspora antimicrobica TaxID=455193 RepID=A0A1I4X3G2_9PSEU|nr:sigma-70 family RNA polymerase sigma factor [Saccharopolyspora antimicrobica]RKT84305.1 RNA polymerase sigma factor (sigma-70 family) [Saccharopolyspora antimicrobica]SFN20618.1 RNA polymerase sigma factor, sigma-70 family [Saccharopolyspora antimicrobica]
MGLSEAAVLSSEDGALLARLRAGDDSAFGELYRRHAPMVRRFALSMQRPGIDVDDVVAEVFLRVLRAVRAGHGPRDAIRTYLFTVVRRVLAEWAAARRDEPMTSDELGEHVPRQGDHQVAQAEGELLARAFLRLPARWREVLWRTEVEGHRPASIARQLGLTPNATAVLAHRARRGLREAYHQASDLPVGRSRRCLRRA